MALGVGSSKGEPWVHLLWGILILAALPSQQT